MAKVVVDGKNPLLLIVQSPDTVDGWVKRITMAVDASSRRRGHWFAIGVVATVVSVLTIIPLALDVGYSVVACLA